jgi:GDPmannose 4,6-dehydratase
LIAKPKTALVTGALGQDGYYLCDLLLKKGYSVIGTSHSRRNENRTVFDADAHFSLRYLELGSQLEIDELISDCRPHEIYNLAGYSSGAGMHDNPVGISEINGLAPLKILESIRNIDPEIRFCQASSSEVFALAELAPQNESTPYAPRSAYGAAKAFADMMVKIYRERYGLFACSAILFNHESPLRRSEFVTRKISRSVAMISAGHQSELKLGDLSSRRDWGHAKDYVRGMWSILHAASPGDYVLSTGRLHSVKDLCDIAFLHVGLKADDYIKVNSSYIRGNYSNQLVGDSSKAKALLCWEPEISFEELISEMVDADILAARLER